MNDVLSELLPALWAADFDIREYVGDGKSITLSLDDVDELRRLAELLASDGVDFDLHWAARTATTPYTDLPVTVTFTSREAHQVATAVKEYADRLQSFAGMRLDDVSEAPTAEPSGTSPI
jgi:hypothetical protein